MLITAVNKKGGLPCSDDPRRAAIREGEKKKEKRNKKEEKKKHSREERTVTRRESESSFHETVIEPGIDVTGTFNWRSRDGPIFVHKGTRLSFTRVHHRENVARLVESLLSFIVALEKETSKTGNCTLEGPL